MSGSRNITVRINDQPRTFDSDVTVLGALRELGLAERRGIAVALDDAVVTRSQWETRTLSDGQRLLIIQATQGG
ncbi:MAG TPA: sulfur carrier protein ThiS [Opitutaceae bacterium]|nr:sulfur carrier protein ThiS [Opitutaceae bacterium]